MKSQYCVVALDASRARFFALDVIKQQAPRASKVSKTPTTKLIEVHDMANPGRRQHAGDAFTDSRPGLNQASGGGPAHGVDDGRDRHLAELDRRFAADISAALAELIESMGASHAILTASPHMLGMVRQQLGNGAKLGAKLSELPKDLSRMTPAALHDYLADAELLPPRGRATL